MPRRTLLILTQIAMMILAFILSALTFTGTVQPWHLIVLAFLLGIANAFDAPARQAFILELVERSSMTNAIALNAAMFNIGSAFGPAVAGMIYAKLGPAWCFTLNGISFLAVIAALVAMKIPPQRVTIHTRAPLLELKEGLLYTIRHPVIRIIVIMVGITGFLGVSFATLFPAWATEVLHGDSVTNGWLQTARGIGALLGALSIAVAGARLKRGQTMTLNLICFPIILIVFSFARTLPLSMVILIGAGMTTILVFNLANALVQTHVPDELRGRVMGIYTLVFFASTPLGSFVAGQVSEKMGAPTAILIDAVLLLIIAIAGWIFLPQIRKLE
jgi:MFS family permease